MAKKESAMWGDMTLCFCESCGRGKDQGKR
jgi:hypothetical protein